MPWWVILIMYLVALHTVYKIGYNKAINKITNEKSTYESLIENDIERINSWHKEYVSQKVSDPKNWDVIRKINKKIGKGMFLS